MRKLDVVFVHPGSAHLIYQGLSDKFSAIETPTWSLLLAQSCRAKGYGVSILDCDAERLSEFPAVERIKEADPRLVCFVVYGQNPNAGTTKMTGAISLAQSLRESYPECKICFVGSHASALPLDVLAYKEVDFVLLNEGVYALHNLLASDLETDLQNVKGIGWKNNGTPVLNEPERVVPTNLMDIDMPGSAWDLLPYKEKPFDLYRSCNWHANFIDEIRNPYAAIYTSLGCQFKCFPGGTKVIISNGPNKAIKNVEIGDKLIGYDESTGKMAETEVTRLIRNWETDYLICIKFENGRTIKCTDEHPFYVHEKWIEAKDLKVGDEIHSMNFREKISFNKHLYNPSFSEEARTRVGKQTKKLYENGMISPLSAPGFHIKYPSYSRNPQKKKLDYVRASERMKENNPMFQEDVRAKQSATTKRKISNGEIIPFMCKKEYWEKISLKPNKMELCFFDILENNFPGEWEFVGDGSVRFDYYSPDFINITGKKKIIEFNGCYWHKCSKCHPEFEENERKRDEDRIKTYEKHGFKTLEVWQHELKDEKSLIKRIGEFLYNGLKIVSISRYGLRKPINVYNFECHPHNNYFVGLSRASHDYILSHNCSFCMINTINRTTNDSNYVASDSNKMRFWSPEFIITEFDKLVEMGVTTIRISDEMFLLMRKYYEPLVKMLAERYEGKLQIWVYSRVDTVNEKHLEMLRKAGIYWLALGVESIDQKIRQEITKGSYKEVDIREVIKSISDAGMYTIANYIFGLPDDTYDSMSRTLDTAIELNTEMVNMYPCFSLPGSPLYLEAKMSGYALPQSFEAWSFHSYESLPMPTKHLSASEVLRFRDRAWQTYFTRPEYLSMIEGKFGVGAKNHIEDMTKIRLKRKILGD